MNIGRLLTAMITPFDENGDINYEIFKNLAYGQWKIEEIYDGSAWDFLSKDLLT